MFINQNIVAIAFRFINFAALIGGAIFLFKKHVMPDLLLDIAKKKDAHDSLFLQQSMLEKQQSNLDALLKKESLQCQEFRSKIDTWKNVVALDAERREKERNDTIITVNNRIAHNIQQREQTRIHNIVTRTVATDLEKSLSLYFKDSKQESDYLNSILHFMDERVS